MYDKKNTKAVYLTSLSGGGGGGIAYLLLMSEVLKKTCSLLFFVYENLMIKDHFKVVYKKNIKYFFNFYFTQDINIVINLNI